MNNRNFKLLNDWLLSLKLDGKKEPNLEDIHVDELVGIKDNKTMFFESLDLFYDLIHSDFSYDFRANYIPSLVFRLEFSEEIIFDVNNNIWEEISISPPNIYLIPKRFFLLAPETFEEYKKPLTLDVFKKFQKDCIIYYRCFRSIEYIRNGWEYTRAVYLTNWGAGYTGDGAC